MQIRNAGSKLQQITRETAPDWKNTKNKQKQQRIQKNIPCIEKCSQKPQDTNQKPKEPETRNEPKTKNQNRKPAPQKNKNTLPFFYLF